MKKQTAFFPDAARYQFDRRFCSNGFAQVDTGQDAWYFGIWANPETFEIFTYAEGDLIYKKAENQVEFVGEMRTIEAFHTRYDDFIGIDPGWEPEPLTTRFTKLGLADLLHSDDRQARRGKIKILLGDQSGPGYPYWLADIDRPKALEIAREFKSTHDPKEMRKILDRLNTHL